MSGNVIGGQKAAATNKAKYGKTFYERIGSIGGAAETGHSFAHGKVDPKDAGKLGGGISKAAWTPERKARHGQMMRQKWAQRRQAEQLFVPDNTDFNEGFNRPSRFKTLMDRMMK